MATNNSVNTSLSGQTGTGNFVGANTPTLITPVIGAATGTSLAVSGNITTSAGNIGIGVTSPAARFTLQDSSGSDQLQISYGIVLGSSGGIEIVNNYNNVTKICGIKFMSITGGDGAIGFYTAISAGGLIERMRIINSGQIGIGTTAPSTLSSLNIQANNPYSLLINPTVTVDDSAEAISIYINPAFNLATNNRSGYGLYVTPSFNPVSTNTIVDAVGATFLVQGTVGAGSVTYAYSAYCNNPTIGTHKIALYTDNFAVGYTGITPPSGGAIISGQMCVGTSSPNTNTQLTITGASTYQIVQLIDGTISGDDGSGEYGARYLTAFNPTNNNISGYGIQVIANGVPHSTNTIPNLYAGYFSVVGTVGAGSITSAYSGYFVNPTVGSTSAVALYADNLVVGSGFLGTTPPSAGAIFNGNVGMGITNPACQLSLGVSTANTKLALYDGGSSSLYGFGVQAGQFIIHLAVNSNKYSFFDSTALTTELVTILGNGNFGIGTTSPNYCLDIAGPFSINGTQQIIMGSVVTMSRNTVTGDITINTNASGNFILSPNNIVSVTTGLSISTAGKTLSIKQGSNACAGTGATMVGGAVTVSTTAVATGDIILTCKTASGGTLGLGEPTVTIVNGTSFTLTSSNALETSTYSWVIIKAA